ncbi:MAG TPA: tripartite tricarboxylate transporter TctB family protein [Acetobacteraceae bacterium]|nr:tripartite tricarboxylate transporter TctB family protein [Acetobacteraceae bacterium]
MSMAMQRVTGAEPQDMVHAPDGMAATMNTVFVPAREDAAGVPMRTMEIGTSLFFAAAGAVAIWDSARIGAGWGADGPQSGYFPFWIGVLLVLAATFNLVGVARATTPRRPVEVPMFLTWEQARTVATVFIPTTIFVAAVPFTGIYVASALLVAWFMSRLGEFSLTRAVPAGVAAALVTFVVFETWFLVALPKGPVETFLGF